jgi:CheY-like chemotaxis protein
MPGVSGFEFLELYNALPENVQSKTVMAVLTTSMHSADTARVAQYPNVEYLTKPLTEEKMQKLLEKRF